MGIAECILRRRSRETSIGVDIPLHWSLHYKSIILIPTKRKSQVNPVMPVANRIPLFH
jgi:hypothetical protein